MGNLITELKETIQKQEGKLIQVQQEKTIQRKSNQSHFEHSMDLDYTVHDETVFNQAEYEHLKIENEHLKEMNEELKDKNELLKEMLQKEKESENKYNKGTFAEVIAGKKQKPKRIPRITIKKTKKEGTLQEIHKKSVMLSSK